MQHTVYSWRACVATCGNVICSSVTEDAQYVTDVNRFLIALAAVQITKESQKKNQQHFSGVEGAPSYLLFPFGRGSNGVIQHLQTFALHTRLVDV